MQKNYLLQPANAILTLSFPQSDLRSSMPLHLCKKRSYLTKMQLI